MKNRAVFLDRDGTLVRDVPYCHSVEDIELLPGVAAGLRMLNANGLKAILVTNQSGIARSYLDEVCLSHIHDRMREKLQNENAWLDAIYFCPHHPDEDCGCRKPHPGMIERAACEHDIDATRSFFIGDRYSDMQAANRAGCKAVIVPTAEPELELLHGCNTNHCHIDYVAWNFIQATSWILANSVPMQDVSFVIPTRNEERNLPHVLPYIPFSAEVIIVDGHSTDNTVEVAGKLRPDARIVMQNGRGKGDALKQGFQLAGGDFVVTFDADGSFMPSEVYKFLNPLRDGYDLVKGSRFMAGGGTNDMPRLRRFGNRRLTRVANVIYGSHYTDLVYGFHAFRRQSLEKLNLYSDGFSLDAELYLKAAKVGLKVKEIPSFEESRIYGTGKLNSLRDGSRILKTIIRERFRE